jgi:hypothetical protein
MKKLPDQKEEPSKEHITVQYMHAHLLSFPFEVSKCRVQTARLVS